MEASACGALFQSHYLVDQAGHDNEVLPAARQQFGASRAL